MELNDILKIGEVCEVSGRVIKAGIYANKNTEYLNFDGAVVKNISIGSYVLIRKGFSNIIGKVEGEYMKEEFSETPHQNKKAINRLVGIGILGAIEKPRKNRHADFAWRICCSFCRGADFRRAVALAHGDRCEHHRIIRFLHTH